MGAYERQNFPFSALALIMTLKERIVKKLQAKKKSNPKPEVSVDSDLTAPVSTTQLPRISILPKDPAPAPDTASNDCNINPVSPLLATKTAINASAIARSVTAASKIAFDVLLNSADVFPPLKSVAGGLSTLLKHYDVCPIFARPNPHYVILTMPSFFQSNLSEIRRKSAG
jgi:hypothetical protein